MNKEKIAAMLLKLRGEKPRKEVAADIGINKNTLQMYETGNRVPKDDIKIKLANYYRKTVQEIFFE